MFLDKGRDHDAAFLGRDTESLHAGSNCLLLSTAKKIECQPAADKPSQYAEPMCLFPRTEFERGNPIMRLLRLPSYKDFVGLKPTLWGIPQPGPDDHWEPFEDSGRWAPMSLNTSNLKDLHGFKKHTHAARSRRDVHAERLPGNTVRTA
ncbi:hypothetical protein Y032_0048g1664 [Ancylostoma ceylanicum]|uniref:Uncharacterized protein n=1 Tax=Ancylostoma ceylanicum TaxID=53326 RepID=A0A016UC66_9BILA|nr:hypothetical protein Y032_0048g1664 [Ancylostoma ceylanicum]